MMYPLVSNLDASLYEAPEAVAFAFAPSVGMSCVDRLTRAIGHDHDYESDEMGACASVYPVDRTDLRLFALAFSVDDSHASTWFRDRRYRARLYRPADVGIAAATHAYVRSDDRGFWDIIFGTEEECSGYLSEWVAENVPTHCDACGEALTEDEEAAYGDACERCAVAFVGEAAR